MVLAACSSFFKAMFTSRMSEARTSHVALQDVSAATVQAIVKFAYTATISLDDHNVQDLLSAANQYQVRESYGECSGTRRDALRLLPCLELVVQII